jgi:hypothetical protein
MGQRIHLRTVPLQIEVRQPHNIFLGRGQGEAPPAPTTNRLRIGMQVFHTWDFANPTTYTPAKIQTSTFLRGYNYQTWKDALTARIVARGGTPSDEIVEAGSNPGTVQLKGLAFFDAASMCDYVWVRIGTPLAQVLEIQARSRIGTKVGFFFFNFESHNIAPQYTAAEEALRQISKQNFLDSLTSTTSRGTWSSGATYAIGDWVSHLDGDSVTRKYICIQGHTNHVPPNTNYWGDGGCDGAGLNGYSSRTIDKYESNDRSGSPCAATWNPSNYVIANPKVNDAATGSKHTADCDVRDGDYVQALVTQFDTHDSPYYVAGSVIYPMRYQMQLWDNLLDQPYKGFAVNDYPSGYDVTAYRGSFSGQTWTGWKGLTGQLLARYSHQGSDFFWCNTGEKTPDSTPVSGESVGFYTAAEIPNRYVEFFFAKPGTNNVQRTLASIQQGIDDAAAHGLRIALGALTGIGAPWATTAGPGPIYGLWADIRTRVESQNAFDKVIPVAARSTSSGYIFWQPEFRDLA